MGQRFQSVFILPPIYISKGNPNNRNETAFIFHNQWLYGFKACEINLLIMQRLKKAFKNKPKWSSSSVKTNQEFINHRLEDTLQNAVKWASLQELFNEREFHEPTQFELGKGEKLSNELLNQDNDNGFFICVINKDLKTLSYCFINGLENTKEYEYKTPEQYSRLFCSEEQFKTLNEKEQEVFEGFKKFYLIDKSKIDFVIEEMNLYRAKEERITY